LTGYNLHLAGDWQYNDIGQSYATSDPSTCATHCNENSSCKGFIIAKDVPGCWLKSNFSNNIININREAYTKPGVALPTIPLSSYTSQQNTDHPYGDLGQFYAGKDATACAKLCNPNNCKGFVTSSTGCWLKSETTPTTTRSDRILYTKPQSSS
jgi:hypothetical protein